MIKTMTCLTVACDGCGEDIEVDNDGTTMHFADAADARQAVNDHEVGFADDQAGDWCDKCRTKPHAFVDAGAWVGRCGRCDVDKGEHGPAGDEGKPTP